MIFASIEEGSLLFCDSGGALTEPSKLARFFPEQRQELVVFLNGLIADGWNGEVICSSSLDFSQEEGWPDDRARTFLSDCLREAVDMVPANVIATLRKELLAVALERDTFSRELAELEHTHEQLCIAAVTLSDERDSLRQRLDAAQKELLRALAEVNPVMSRSAADAPLDGVAPATFADDLGAYVPEDGEDGDDEEETAESTYIRFAEAEKKEPAPEPHCVLNEYGEPHDCVDDGYGECPFCANNRDDAPAPEPVVAEDRNTFDGGDFLVSAEEFEALQDILEHPPAPTPLLVALMQGTAELEDPPPAPEPVVAEDQPAAPAPELIVSNPTKKRRRGGR